MKAETQQKDQMHFFAYKTLLCGIKFSSIIIIITTTSKPEQKPDDVIKSLMEFSRLKNMLYICNFFALA